MSIFDENKDQPSKSDVWLNQLDQARKQVNERGREATPSLHAIAVNLWKNIFTDSEYGPVAQQHFADIIDDPIVEAMVNPNKWDDNVPVDEFIVKYEILRSFIQGLFIHG